MSIVVEGFNIWHFLTALFTILGSIAVIVYAVFAGLLWKVTRDTLRRAEDAFHLNIMIGVAQIQGSQLPKEVRDVIIRTMQMRFPDEFEEFSRLAEGAY